MLKELKLLFQEAVDKLGERELLFKRAILHYILIDRLAME